MRFTINREQFLKGLTVASKPVPVKSYIAALLFLKLELDERGLTLTGSSGNLSIATTIPYMIGEQEIIRNAREGGVLLQSRYLTEIIRKLSSEEVSFEVIDESVAKIEDERSSFKLNCMNAEDYPEIDFERSGTVFDVKCSELTNLVDQTAFAASTKDQKPALMALNLTGEGGKLYGVATDSARLAKKEIELEADVNFTANIPAKVIQDVVRLFEGEETVTLAINDKKVLFAFGNTCVTSSLINFDYPNTKNIVPHGFNYTLTANAQELISALDRVSLLSVERLNIVKLTMNSEEVEVASKSSEIGSANEKIANFEFSGERLEVSFNSEYVLAAIRALKCEEVTICFIGEMRPFVIKNSKDDSVVQLVTPVRA